jgi:hypothetical protein
MKYKVGDLVRLNSDAEDYEVIVKDITYEDVGLVTSLVSGQVTHTVGGKPIVHRDWYDVLFTGQEHTISLEEWEIEPL